MGMTDNMGTVGSPPTGLNAAQNFLLAPAGTSLTAWKISGP
jgi:hypothetical protein